MAQANGVITMAGGPDAVSAAWNPHPSKRRTPVSSLTRWEQNRSQICDVRTNFAMDCFVARPC